jgi:hypothetical protein
MNKEDWKEVLEVLKKVPENYRSQNHSAYLHEVEMMIYDLEQKEKIKNLDNE